MRTRVEKTVGEGRICSLHLLLPSDLGAPGSRTFGLRLGLNTIGSFGSQAFGFGLEQYHWLSWTSSRIVDLSAFRIM